MTTYFIQFRLLPTVVAVLGFFGPIFAQEMADDSGISTKKGRFFDDFRAEIGINTIPLLRTVSNRGPDSLNQSPYLIQGRLSWRNIGVRGSIGGRYSKSNSFVEGFKDSEKITNSLINYRVGLDYRFTWDRKFNLSVGADWVARTLENTRVLDSGFDIIEFTDVAYLAGGGLSITGGYWPTSRLGFGMEVSAYYLQGEMNGGRKFVNFPELNDDLLVSELEEISFPVGLFAIWKF
jgi:hypothetical protein